MSDVSRRDLLAAAAAASAPDLAPFVRPARATSDAPTLQSIFISYKHASARLRALDVAEAEAEARYVEPELPRALLPRGSDIAHLGALPLDPIDWSDTSRGGAYTSGKTLRYLEDLRTSYEGERAEWPGSSETLARIAEITDAMALWHAEVAKRWAAVGLDAIQEEWHATTQKCMSLRQQVSGMPALTLQDVLVKARIAGDCFETFDPNHPDAPPISAEVGIREEMADQPWTRDGVLHSILLDLLRMAERGLPVGTETG